MPRKTKKAAETKPVRGDWTDGIVYPEIKTKDGETLFGVFLDAVDIPAVLRGTELTLKKVHNRSERPEIVSHASALRGFAEMYASGLKSAEEAAPAATKGKFKHLQPRKGRKPVAPEGLKPRKGSKVRSAI